MRTVQSFSWIVSFSMLVLGAIATPAQADRSYSDITGTNIWNNTAPIFETDGKLDPDLIERINRINRESAAAFDACNTAIAQVEQRVETPRRFAREPSTETLPVPTACRQLEELRGQAESLRRTLEQVEQSRTNPEFLTW